MNEPVDAVRAPSGGSIVQAPVLVNGVLIAGVHGLANAAGEGGVSPLGVLSWQLLFAAIVIGLVAALRGEVRVLSRAQDLDLALLGAGILTTAFCVGAFELQRRDDSAVAGQFGDLITVAKLAIGTLAVGERHPLTLLVAVVSAGVTLVNRRPTAAAGARR